MVIVIIVLFILLTVSLTSWAIPLTIPGDSSLIDFVISSLIVYFYSAVILNLHYLLNPEFDYLYHLHFILFGYPHQHLKLY